ncbi:MAG: MetQ/NlpA family ABC transporter substrate-binding protein [Eggerthellaceae bacterium]
MTKIRKSKLGLVGIIAVVTALALAAVVLSGCGSSSSTSSDNSDKTITVAASPNPHADILNNAVKPLLEEQGYTLQVEEFTDYVQPNNVTEQGEVDANYFQHQPYLDNFNEENGTHLVSVEPVHFEPFGLYSNKIQSLDDLEDGATVAVPNDATNEARALLLLQQEGLLELKDPEDINATINDITSNPKNLQFKEVEAASVSTILDDVDLAAINGNYALEAGFTVNEDALAVESADSVAGQTYANVLVVKDGNQDSEKIKALADALHSDEVRNYINDTYKGAVVPEF